MLVVLGVTLVGESLNDLADPRLRTRRRASRVPSPGTEVAVVPGGTLDDVLSGDDLGIVPNQRDPR